MTVPPSEPLALGPGDGGFLFRAWSRDAAGAETPVDPGSIAAVNLLGPGSEATPVWQLTGLPDLPDGAESIAVAVISGADPSYVLQTYTYRRPTAPPAVVWLRQGQLLAPLGKLKTGQTWGQIAWQVPRGLADLTGATAVFSAKDPATGALVLDHKPAAIAGVIEASDGSFGCTLVYELASGAFADPGVFAGEFVLTYAGGANIPLPEDESMGLQVVRRF